MEKVFVPALLDMSRESFGRSEEDAARWLASFVSDSTRIGMLKVLDARFHHIRYQPFHWDFAVSIG